MVSLVAELAGLGGGIDHKLGRGLENIISLLVISLLEAIGS